MERPGFSLLETVLVIALLVILAAVGPLLSLETVRRQELRTAADAVRTEVTRAKTEGYVQQHDASHGVKLFSDRAVSFSGTSYAARTVSLDRETPFGRAFTVSGDDEIVFPAGTFHPDAPAVMTLDDGALAIDLTIPLYGSPTLAERTIAP